MEDFADIGGQDFVTLPWPHTTGVVSGISDESQYIKSIKNVLEEGKLSENDVIDSVKLLEAVNNDEIGDYIGDTDIEQIRIFKGPYDMHKLLDISNSVVVGDNFHPFTDDIYWDLSGSGDNNTFPMESSIDKIFINDSLDQNLRNNCIIELNAREIDGDIIRDSSGNRNKGILIGDYKIDKPTIDIPIRRKSNLTIPTTGEDNGAL